MSEHTPGGGVTAQASASLYRPPAITRLGTLTELTQGSGPYEADGLIGIASGEG